MIDELQRHIDKVMNEQNNQGLPNFEGYSPIEMRHILYDPFGDYSPIRLFKLADSDYKIIPILNQIKYLAKLVDKLIELKLTNKGFLPTKIVADIYNQGFIKDEFIESRIYKLYKESDCPTINLTRIFLTINFFSTIIFLEGLNNQTKVFVALQVNVSSQETSARGASNTLGL